MKNSFLQNACKTAMIFCRQHKSTILSVVSAVGVVATGVLSARGGIKAERILKDKDDYIHILNDDGTASEEKVYSPEPKWKQAVRLVPAILPPVLTAAGTIALIFFNDAQNRQAQAALAGAYALMAKKLADYKAEVTDTFGDKADRLVEESIADKRLQDNDILAEERADDAKLWYDHFSERWFWATGEEVSDAEFFANRIFRMQGYVTLNDFYNLVPGLSPIPEGDELGWDEYVGEVCYGYTWIDFAHIDHNEADDARSYRELYFPFTPHPFYEETIEMEKEYERICSDVRKESPNEV